MKNDSSFRNNSNPVRSHRSDDDLQSIFGEERSTTSSATSCTWSDSQVMNAWNTKQQQQIKKKMSPATQTLHQLSQTVDQLDLLCHASNNSAVVDSPLLHNRTCPPEFSQYEFSVAAILATAAHAKNNDDDDKEHEARHYEEEMASRNDNIEEEKSIAAKSSSSALAKTKSGRRGKTQATKRKAAVKPSKPSRVKHATTTSKKKASNPRKEATTDKSKQRPATKQSSTNLPNVKNVQGSYRSKAVEKWRGDRLVQVYPSMRQAAEAVGTHHGYIKQLVQTGEIANGFVWKFQNQKSSSSAEAKKTAAKAKPATKPKQEEKPKAKQSRGTKSKVETPVSQSQRASRSTPSVPSSPSPVVSLKKKSPVKYLNPIRRKAKSVQRLNPDGSVAKTFPSMLQASIVTGISRRDIRECLTDIEVKDKNGFGWRSMETIDTPSVPGTAKKETVSETNDRTDRSVDQQGEKALVVKQAPSLNEEMAVVVDASEDKQSPPFPPAVNENRPKSNQGSAGPQFNISFVEITSTGKLGLNIRSMSLDDEARASVTKSSSIQVLAFAKGCTVENVISGSLCDTAGIRSGDTLFLVQKREGRPCLNGNYDMILEAARSGQRPIKFCIARPIVKKLTFIPQANVARSKSQANVEPKSKPPPSVELTKTPAMVELTVKKLSAKQPPSVELSKTQTKVKPPQLQPEVNSNAPFCALCSGEATKHQVHHAWCQRNPQFQKSGAHEVLRRITEGIKLGCNVCEMEFRTGRAQLNLVHTVSCEENQKVIFDVEELPQQVPVKSKVKRHEKKPSSSQPTEAASKKQDTIQPALKTKRGRSVKVSSKILTSEAYLSDIGRDGSDASEDLEPQRKRKPVSSLFRADRTPEPKQVTIKSNSLNHRKAAPQSQGDVAPAPRTNPNVASKTVDAITNAETKQYASFAADYSSESDAEYDGSGELEIAWEPCPDPWGEKGFVDGDVVVFSKQTGIGNVETVLPSPRFASDPLSGSCRYKKTHHMPNEGFQALLLQRDPQRTLSWGFSVHRHEFGGACLVSSVEPMSPAQAAVFVGAHNEDRPRAALRTNDMIMTLDGKEVGGMTVESFQLALELAGSELILVVSRYKCLAQEASADQEAQSLSEVDKHINDPNRLDWADIGRSSTSAFHRYSRIEETEHTYQSSPESNVSLHSKPPPTCISTAEDRNPAQLESDASREEEVNHPSNKQSEAPSIKQVQNITEHQNDSIREGGPESENSSVLSSVEPTDLRSVLEADEASSNSDEFGEDGNAWCGCVCGKEHAAKGNYFWIQCEACYSWFNVYERCVGFGKKEAERMEEWTCWACEEAKSLKTGDKVSGVQKHASPKQERKQKTPRKASSQKSRNKVSVEQQRKEEISKKLQSDEETDSIESEDNSETASQGQHAHKVGSLVFIREHAWSGVNNPEGIARVTGVHMDKEDGRTYDVKYIVGPSSKGVFARYVTPHTFY